MGSVPLNQKKIKDFAEKFNTHPTIIIGRLQLKKIILYNVRGDLIVPIDIDCQFITVY